MRRELGHAPQGHVHVRAPKALGSAREHDQQPTEPRGTMRRELPPVGARGARHERSARRGPSAAPGTARRDSDRSPNTAAAGACRPPHTRRAERAERGPGVTRRQHSAMIGISRRSQHLDARADSEALFPVDQQLATSGYYALGIPAHLALMGVRRRISGGRVWQFTPAPAPSGACRRVSGRSSSTCFWTVAPRERAGTRVVGEGRAVRCAAGLATTTCVAPHFA